MPYTLQDFGELETPKANGADDIQFSGGRVISELSPRLRTALHKRRDRENEDASTKDFGYIVSMLEEGHSTQNVYATFIASVRGKAAISDHSDAWVRMNQGKNKVAVDLPMPTRGGMSTRAGSLLTKPTK